MPAATTLSLMLPRCTFRDDLMLSIYRAVRLPRAESRLALSAKQLARDLSIEPDEGTELELYAVPLNVAASSVAFHMEAYSGGTHYIVPLTTANMISGWVPMDEPERYPAIYDPEEGTISMRSPRAEVYPFERLVIPERPKISELPKKFLEAYPNFAGALRRHDYYFEILLGEDFELFEGIPKIPAGSLLKGGAIQIPSGDIYLYYGTMSTKDGYSVYLYDHDTQIFDRIFTMTFYESQLTQTNPDETLTIPVELMHRAATIFNDNPIPEGEGESASLDVIHSIYQ